MFVYTRLFVVVSAILEYSVSIVVGSLTQNPAQVGVALQVFHNLGQLGAVLVSILTGYQEAVLHEIQNAVDPATLLQGHTSASN